MSKNIQGLTNRVLENVKLLAGAIPLVIMAVIFIASILQSISPDIWDMTVGELVKHLFGMTLFGLIIIFPIYIKYRRAKARHIKWHKDNNIPLANNKGQCYCESNEEAGITKTI